MPKKTRLLTREDIDDFDGNRSVWLKETVVRDEWVPMHEMFHSEAACRENIMKVQAQHPPQIFALRAALYVRAEEKEDASLMVRLHKTETWWRNAQDYGARLLRSNAALRGVITKLKNRIRER